MSSEETIKYFFVNCMTVNLNVLGVFKVGTIDKKVGSLIIAKHWHNSLH